MSTFYKEVTLSELTISRSEIYRTMGYGEVTPEAEICEMVEALLGEAATITRPRCCFKMVDECTIHREAVEFEGYGFQLGKTIAGLLRRSESLVFFIATAGEEYQKWHDEVTNEGDALKLFIVDSLGSVIAESAGDYMESCLEKQITGLKHTNRFSPGYCDWDIREQRKLFSLLSDNTCGVDLNDVCLMHPIKSISGVIGVGENVLTKKYGCSICKRTDCYLRKA
ncbi:MAG: vitamin B12 dependent-methionine synthase activation domain-containing protein [Rikenellaceae bacterium]